MVQAIESKAQFDACLADNEDKLIVVFFWAIWSGPCKSIAPVFEKLADENPDVIFLKVDTSNEEIVEACASAIRTLPTFLFYKNGKEIGLLCGAQRQKLESLVAKNK